MKKLLKSFSFWFVILSLFEIRMHQIGQDSKSIILIWLNPILNYISHSDIGCNFMNSGMQIKCKTIMGAISIYWYFGCVLSFLFYGLILDSVKFSIKRICNYISGNI